MLQILVLILFSVVSFAADNNSNEMRCLEGIKPMLNKNQVHEIKGMKAYLFLTSELEGQQHGWRKDGYLLISENETQFCKAPQGGWSNGRSFVASNAHGSYRVTYHSSGPERLNSSTCYIGCPLGTRQDCDKHIGSEGQEHVRNMMMDSLKKHLADQHKQNKDISKITLNQYCDRIPGFTEKFNKARQELVRPAAVPTPQPRPTNAPQ